MITLRPWQESAVEALREGIRAGHRRQLLVAPTGSGKTFVASSMLKSCSDNGKRAAFLVDRVALVKQTSAAFHRFEIPHGIAQSDNTFGRQEPIQLCSQQTVEKRGFFPDMALGVLDECHTMRKAVTEFFERVKIPLIGLTATPFTEGMGRFYSNVVNVTTTNKLVDEGHLVPLQVYAAKEVDMTGAKTVAGEWRDKEVGDRATRIVGDVVLEWIDKTQKHFGGPVKTICFSATVAHGEEICRQFQAAGFNFQQVSYRDNLDEREKLLDEFRKENSVIDGLVSVEALAKGFDAPDILCGICARPFRKSFASHIQMLGRVMRSHPGKKYALWLDHSGNYLGFFDRMVDLFAHGVSELDLGEKVNAPREENAREKTDAVCFSCGFVLPPGMQVCASCGTERRRKNSVEVVTGRLEEVETNVKPIKPYLQDPEAVWRQILFNAALRKKGNTSAALKFAYAQYRQFYNAWPQKEWGESPGEFCNPALASHIKHNVIRYARRRVSA